MATIQRYKDQPLRDQRTPQVGDLVTFYNNGVQYCAEVKTITEGMCRSGADVSITGGDEDQSLAEPYAGRPHGTDVYTIESK